VKSKSIMRCMLIALLFLVLGLAWAPNIMAQSCSASNNVSVIPSPTTVHTGDPITWTISITNNCVQNDSPYGSVPAKLLADGSPNHPPLELTMAMDLLDNPISGTFTFNNCSSTTGMTCVIKPGDSNVILMYTGPSGVDFVANQTITLGEVHATAVLPVPTATHVVKTQILGLLTVDGVFSTDTALCDPKVNSGAQGTTTEFFPPRPCIHVTKSVDPLKTKPTDGVVYHIEVCNCGDIALTGVTVNDTILGNLVPSYFPATLAIGQCVSKDIPWTIPSNANVTVPYVNIVTVNSSQTAESCLDCTGASCVSCTTTAQASVELFKPDVTISKTCPCTPSNQSIGCQVGDDVKYTISVHNNSTSNTPSITCNVDDNNLYNTIHDTLIWATSTGQSKAYTNTIKFPNISDNCINNTVNLHCTIAGFPNVINKSADCEVCVTPPTTTGGEEPFKAVVWDDLSIPGFYISGKLSQFIHPDTNYYAGCTDVLFPGDPRITSECKVIGNSFECPSACSESFKSKTAATKPEVCCTSETLDDLIGDSNTDLHCPDVKTALTTKGNSGWYEWVIALPKKPVDEMNIEIECGVLKPNSWALFGPESIEVCAAVTGEQIGPNCTRIPGTNLLPSALPRLEVTAHPGCNNDFKPFHLTAYRTPSSYGIPNKPQLPGNTKSLQILDGNPGASIALKACMEETVLVKWPKDGEVNAMGEPETALEHGDLIKVRMEIPNANTVDVYCSAYSVTIGGIGIPTTLLKDYDCGCISDADCKW
jgi:uncharacterized repeat protein (TIGR01451 family)